MPSERELIEAAGPLGGRTRTAFQQWAQRLVGDVSRTDEWADIIYDGGRAAAFIAAAREGWPAALDRAERAEAKVARLREGLGFYAGGASYSVDPCGDCEVLDDDGETARAALEARHD